LRQQTKTQVLCQKDLGEKKVYSCLDNRPNPLPYLDLTIQALSPKQFFAIASDLRRATNLFPIESSVAAWAGEHSFFQKNCEKAKNPCPHFRPNCDCPNSPFCAPPRRSPCVRPAGGATSGGLLMAHPDPPRADSPSPPPDPQEPVQPPSKED